MLLWLARTCWKLVKIPRIKLGRVTERKFPYRGPAKEFFNHRPFFKASWEIDSLWVS